MMRNGEGFADLAREPWAIVTPSFAAISQFAEIDPSLSNLSPEDLWSRMVGANSRAAPRVDSSTAIISVYGVIGKITLRQLTFALRDSLADSRCGSIVFEFDSPGGIVEGIEELCAEIYAGRSLKKIIAVANVQAESGAYWLASAASELVVTPSGSIGSIGVFAAHEDISAAMKKAGVKISLMSAGKYKTEGNPYEPLSDGARGDLKSKVDAHYEKFISAVARNRNVPAFQVRRGFGEGRSVLAADAVRAGMADRVATLDQTLARFGGSGRQTLADRYRYLNALSQTLELNDD